MVAVAIWDVSTTCFVCRGHAFCSDHVALQTFLTQSDCLKKPLKHKPSVGTCVSELQGFHASWKVLDFFPENSRTWKVPENHFGPRKSWELKPSVLESLWGNILESHAFFQWFKWPTSSNSIAPVCVDCCWLKYSVECWWIVPPLLRVFF